MTDDFDQIVAGLDLTEAEPSDVIDVSELDDLDLVDLNAKVRRNLLESRQMLSPTTREGRDLHSLRVAILTQMTKRGLR